jgi:peptidylprolyl isomerase/peptidyl-prolyl cis-trans isomerase D
MAILGKIRERSLFLIIVIALALFSFVIGDVFTRGGYGGNKNSVGEINGENISREEFAQLVEQQRARTGNRGSQMQSVNTAWNNLIREKVYKTQLEKSGIIVGEKDVWDEIVKQTFVQNNPQFKNEIGLFDEEKFKEYIATLQDAATEDEQGKAAWLGWLNYEKNIKSNLQINTYNNLITAGLGVTLKEGEHYYFDNNTKLDLEYVYIPYSYIADSLVNITDDEIKKYVKGHSDEYKAEASRNISFVKFDIKATPEDEKVIKSNLGELINDREEYSSAAKTNIKINGFANTTSAEEFFRENSSDTPLDTKFYTKSKLNKTIADTIFNFNVGNIYGPYKDGEYFKLSKLLEVKQLPDSVKARHILIPFVGSLRADPSITQTEEGVKKTADSLLAIIKKDKSKFADIAKNLSSDKGSGAKGGDLDWFTYDRMVSEFRDYTFENNVGDINIVKSDFGFHIIEIQGQKNKQKMISIATFSRKIEASEETENDIFQKAETFASELSNGKDIVELAKENKLVLQPVIGLKAMDEKISTLGDQRQIVTWTFEKQTKENNIKRFDVDKGYAVVKLTAKHKKGLSIGTSKFKIRTILLNKKKVKLIKEKIKGDNLQEIAKVFSKTVNSSKAVSLGSPVLPGVGRSADLVTILTSLDENKIYKGIKAQNGVFVVKILKKEKPKTLDNYSSFTTIISNINRLKSNKAFDALKEIADIEDNRASLY